MNRPVFAFYLERLSDAACILTATADLTRKVIASIGKITGPSAKWPAIPLSCLSGLRPDRPRGLIFSDGTCELYSVDRIRGLE